MRPHLKPEQIALRRTTQTAVDALFTILRGAEGLVRQLQEAIEIIQATCPHPTRIGNSKKSICRLCGKKMPKAKKKKRQKK